MSRQDDDSTTVHMIDADPRSIRDVLGVSRSLEVPLYQRSFAWTKSEIDELWEDLQGLFNHEETSYFLGPMVFVRRNLTHVEVVDGQQRLSALSVLFSVIRDAYRESNHPTKATIIESQTLFLQRDLRTEDAAPKLTVNETDNAVFLEIINGKHDREHFHKLSQDRQAPESNKLLAGAYVSYYDQIYQRTQQFTDVDSLNDLAEALLGKIVVIEIVTTTDEAAYTLFETLNDRGADLTLSDLLKNYLFGKAGGRLSEVRKLWTEIMATVGQGVMTQFIRHEWMSRNGKIREPILYRKLKERIKTVGDVMEYVAGLRKAADVYAALQNPASPMWKSYSASAKQMLKQIAVFKVVQCYPLLLSAQLERNARDFETIASWIVALTMRYNIIGGKGTGNLETAYAKASPVCREKARPISEVRGILAEIYPDDNEFRSSFAVKRQSEEPIVRLMLSELEKAISGTDEKVADPDSLTLEHVLPKSPGAGWDANLQSTALHGVLLNRIGNLTLLTGEVNSRLPDAFEDKKVIYSASTIAITQALAKHPNWGEAAIDERQQELAEVAVKIWAF